MLVEKSDHVGEMIVVVGELGVERRVEATEHEVAVVLVLHQLAHATRLQPADALTLQHVVDHVLQVRLVVAARIKQTNTQSRIIFYVG